MDKDWAKAARLAAEKTRDFWIEAMRKMRAACDAEREAISEEIRRKYLD